MPSRAGEGLSARQLSLGPGSYSPRADRDPHTSPHTQTRVDVALECDCRAGEQRVPDTDAEHDQLAVQRQRTDPDSVAGTEQEPRGRPDGIVSLCLSDVRHEPVGQRRERRERDDEQV